MLRSRRDPTPDTPALAALSEQRGEPIDAIVREAIAHVAAPDRREALRIYFEEVYGEDRRALTPRRTDAGSRIGYTEPAMRNRPQGDHRRSHEFRLIAELAEAITSTHPAPQLTEASDRITSEPSGVDAKTRSSTWMRVPAAVAVLVVLAIVIGVMSTRRTEGKSTDPKEGQTLTIDYAKSMISAEGDAECVDPKKEFSDPLTNDAELRSVTVKIRQYVQQQRAAGEFVGCRLGESSWVDLARDPRLNERPDIETRVAIENYVDESGFKGAVFATAKSTPVFVPGPSQGAWQGLNQYFPIGYPVSFSRSADGSVQTRLSTDYPLTRGSLVAVRYDTIAYFLPWSIEQEHPLEERGHPLANLSGPVVPGATTQDYERGQFTLSDITRAGEPVHTFKPWPENTAPKTITDFPVVVRDSTRRTEWLLNADGTRQWLPSGAAVQCYKATVARTIAEPLDSITLARFRVVETARCATERHHLDCALAFQASSDTTPATLTQLRDYYTEQGLQQLGCPRSDIHEWGAGMGIDLDDPVYGWSAIVMARGAQHPVWLAGTPLRWLHAQWTGKYDVIGLPSGQPVICGSSWVIPLSGGSRGPGWIELLSSDANRLSNNNEPPPCE